MMKGFDHHHVGSRVEFHILGQPQAGPGQVRHRIRTRDKPGLSFFTIHNVGKSKMVEKIPKLIFPLVIKCQ